ncbi:response regulator [Zunongwangia pacifica]|uniref:Response regulator transcription factor n=1 Tax=Zunongwangia pacifica TaxID=2911062 RepID=A0A9X2CMS1_9FLAO|nr:response regulator transcription factor [Zunongwangia pacifica]MCL6217859.1 response regulator transcription factor [Zunongwangia pacifica]
MMIRIGIVDDNHFLLKALEEKISFFEDLVHKFSCTSGAEVLEHLECKLTIDIILMDIEMPGINGIETTEILKKRYPQIKVVMLTVFDNEEHIFNAIKAGADGYLLKDTPAEVLYQGILETMEGGAAMSPKIAKKTLKLLRHPDLGNLCSAKEQIGLSNREIEILEQLAVGLSYTKIAENLFISPSTVRKHIENIYKKLQVHSKLEAVEKARNYNII